MSHSIKILSILLSLSTWASAGPAIYLVTVNTSSVSGISGSLDLNFNPGPLGSQTASVQITGFSSDGTLAATPSTIGDSTGALSSTLYMDNGTPFNDYFTGFKYGSTLSFSVGLSGPALSAPDGVSSSGSSFAFSMFSNAAGTVPVLTTDTVNGLAYIVNVNLDGSTTVIDNISNAPNSTPEPASAALLLSGLGISLFAARRQYKQAR